MNRFPIFSLHSTCPGFFAPKCAAPRCPYQMPSTTWRDSWNRASWIKRIFGCTAAGTVGYVVLKEIQEIKKYNDFLVMDSEPTTKVGQAKAWMSCTLDSYAERKRLQYINKIVTRCLFFIERPDRCRQFFSYLTVPMQREIVEELLLQSHMRFDTEESPKILQAILMPEIIDKQDLLHVLNRVLQWPSVCKNSLFRQIFESQILTMDDFPKYGVHAIFCNKEPSFIYDNTEEVAAKLLESLERSFEKTGEIPEKLSPDIYQSITFPSLPAYGRLFLSLISSDILTTEERNKLLSEVVLNAEWELFKKEEVQDDELLGLCIGKALSYSSLRDYAKIKRATSFLSSECVLTVESSSQESAEMINRLRLSQKINFLESSQGKDSQSTLKN